MAQPAVSSLVVAPLCRGASFGGPRPPRICFGAPSFPPNEAPPHLNYRPNTPQNKPNPDKQTQVTNCLIWTANPFCPNLIHASPYSGELGLFRKNTVEGCLPPLSPLSTKSAQHDLGPRPNLLSGGAFLPRPVWTPKHWRSQIATKPSLTRRRCCVRQMSLPQPKSGRQMAFLGHSKLMPMGFTTVDPRPSCPYVKELRPLSHKSPPKSSTIIDHRLTSTYLSAAPL